MVAAKLHALSAQRREFVRRHGANGSEPMGAAERAAALDQQFDMPINDRKRQLKALSARIEKHPEP